MPGVGPQYPVNGGAVGPGVNGGAVGMQICCPSGQHPNKSSYFLRDGTFIPKESKCVTNRKTNPLNPAAASRAGKRLRSAAKASKWLQKCKIPKR
jgi:hypothetical protein